MKINHLFAGIAIGLCSCIAALAQGTVIINDPSGASEEVRLTLSAAEQAIMDRDVLPKVRVKLGPDACGADEEAGVVAGRSEGAFTRPGAKQVFLFYQFCQTGNGIGSAGVAIIEGGRLVASFVAPQSGWTVSASELPDINQNGLNEIALYYSGGMHQGAGGTGVDIVEVSGGTLKGLGWYQAEGFTEKGPVTGWRVTVNPGKRPVFFREKYIQNASGKWRKTGKPLPLKLGEITGPFETLK